MAKTADKESDKAMSGLLLIALLRLTDMLKKSMAEPKPGDVNVSLEEASMEKSNG